MKKFSKYIQLDVDKKNQFDKMTAMIGFIQRDRNEEAAKAEFIVNAASLLGVLNQKEWLESMSGAIASQRLRFKSGS